MGYSTDFTGELKFSEELKAGQLAFLNTILGEDCRDHPEWDVEKDLYGIDLDLLEDFSGLVWNGAEKTYDMDKLIETVIKVMRTRWPKFSMDGKLLAQGEDIDDRYEIHVNGERVEIKNVVIEGTKITCPHCEEQFVYNPSSV